MPSPKSLGVPTRYPSIPEPANDIQSIRETLMRMKEALELLTGQRGTSGDTEFSVQGALRQIEAYGSRVIELRQVDEGLAQQITQVETTVGDLSTGLDDITVSGQVVIRAEANPTGYKAYFGVYLRAASDSVPGTERRAGFNLGLSNADGAVATFEVGQFTLKDITTGVPTTVFDYSAGKFTLNGNVTVNGNLLINGSISTGKYGDLTISTNKVIDNAISTNSIQVSAGASATVGVSLRAGSKLAILATWNALNERYVSVTPSGAPGPLLYQYIQGVVANFVNVSVVSFTHVGVHLMQPTSQTMLTSYTVPSDGIYTLMAQTDVRGDGAVIGTTAILVLELAK